MQQATGKGKMAAVELAWQEIERLLSGYEDRLCIAAINSPTSTVVSGETDALLTFLDVITQKHPGVTCKYLPVNYAFHSHQVESIKDELIEAIQDIQPQKASIPIFSTVSGDSVAGTDLDADYWGHNMRQPVRFAPAIDALAKAGHHVFVEISPHPVLSGYITQCLSDLEKEGVVLPSLRRTQEEQLTLLNSLGRLYTLGYSIDWQQLYPSEGEVVRLPSYPWQRDRYWIEAKQQKIKLIKKNTATHPLLGQKLQLPLKEIVFESELSSELQPLLEGHQVCDRVVLPGAAYLELALAAGTEIFGSGTYVLEDVSIQEALIIPEGQSRILQVVLTPEGDKKASFRIVSRIADENDKAIAWMGHATGKVALQQLSEPIPVALNDLQQRIPEAVSVREYYQQLLQRGLKYGASFQGIEQLWRRDGEALGRIRLPEIAIDNAYQLHPVLIDSGLQLLFATLAEDNQDTYLPVGLERLRVYRTPDTQLWTVGRMRQADNASSERLADLQWFDESGQIIAEIEGLQVKRIPRKLLQNSFQDWLYEMKWEPKSDSGRVMSKVEGRWLIFSDRKGIGQQLATQLTTSGDNCILVFPGKFYQKLSLDRYELNPTQREDFEQLLKDRLPWKGIIHLWSVDVAASEKMTVADLENSSTLGCRSVTYLLQSLIKAEFPQLPELWLVTQGAQPVGETSTPLTLAQAPLWGLGKTLSLEHPDLRCVQVDLDPSGMEQAKVLFDALHSDPADNEDRLAFRQEQRYVLRLTRGHEVETQPVKIQPEATYLIAGGLGGLGLLMARWLVERGARHLVLLGRRSASQEAIEEITQLEQTGAKIATLQTDITQTQQLASLLSQIEDTMPPLKGVIHAAGIFDVGLLAKQDWEAVAKVLAPKVQGAWNLHLLTQHLPLDFFILFSSIASLLGAPGQANHSAANAFLDALAHHRHTRGLPALSINWGAWSEVGAVGKKDMSKLTSMHGLGTIAPQDGLQLLEQIFHYPSPQIGVTPVQWNRFLESFSVCPPLLSEFVLETGINTTAEPIAEQALELLTQLEKQPRKRQELLTAFLREQVIKVLRLSSSYRLDIHQSLFDMGMDSLTSVELRNRLQTLLGRSLSSTALFDYPNIDALVQYITSEMFAVSPEQEPEEKHSTITPTTLTNIEQISEDEAEALLLKQLEKLKC
jgi:acyl transferase domain-containing protein/acyl carrier protein